MMFLSFLLGTTGLTGTGEEGEGGCGGAGTYVMLGVLVLAMVLIFVWPMITNRKKGKQINDMRTTLRVGDEIMTIGGMVGKIVEVKEHSTGEKDFVIETGSGDRKSYMTFDLRALHENRTRMLELKEEAAKQAEIQRIQKEQKRLEKENKQPAESKKESGDDKNK